MEMPVSSLTLLQSAGDLRAYWLCWWCRCILHVHLWWLQHTGRVVQGVHSERIQDSSHSTPDVWRSTVEMLHSKNHFGCLRDVWYMPHDQVYCKLVERCWIWQVNEVSGVFFNDKVFEMLMPSLVDVVSNTIGIWPFFLAHLKETGK